MRAYAVPKASDPDRFPAPPWKRLEQGERGCVFTGHEAHDAWHLTRIAEAQRRGLIRQDLARGHGPRRAPHQPLAHRRRSPEQVLAATRAV